MGRKESGSFLAGNTVAICWIGLIGGGGAGGKRLAGLRSGAILLLQGRQMYNCRSSSRLGRLQSRAEEGVFQSQDPVEV